MRKSQLKQLLKQSFHLLIVMWLCGCASLISRGASSPPMLDLEILNNEQMESIGYQYGAFCTSPVPCMSYIQAKSYDNKGRQQWAVAAKEWQKDGPLITEASEVSLRTWPFAEETVAARSKRVAMRYEIELDTTRGNDAVTLLLDAPVPTENKGTYVLIHGFRTNKASLFFIAESMRFAGFNVVMVDLFGHGGSQGEFTFSGKPDAAVISQLIDDLDLEGPLHVAGMSMGGTTSVHLVKQRNDLESLMLLAPMLQFVDAFVDAGRAYTRSAHLVPQSSLQKGARYALDEAGTDVEDTAVVKQVGSLSIPVLIMGSVDDKLSPLQRLQEIKGDNITVHAVQPRTHHGMVLWDTEDFSAWLNWLQQN